MNKRILVIDDDPAILEAISTVLEDAGYSVERDIQGERVDTISTDTWKKPRVIILDIFLSGEDGRIIAKKLKREKQTADIPIIMMSASSNIRNSAKNAGADSFLSKPFDVDDLLKEVKQFVQN